MMIYGSVIRFFYLLVGCLYPAVASFKILNGNDIGAKCNSNNLEAQRIWLSYWIVYAIYITIDSISQLLEAFIPIPFFKEFKLLFLCWLLPSVGGGHKLVYDEFICAFFKQNEYSMDQAIGHAVEMASQMLGKFLNFILRHLIMISESFLCLIRRNQETESSHLRLTPSVEVIVNQILAKRRARDKTIVKSNQSQFDLFQDLKEDLIQDVENRKPPNLLVSKVAQKPPCPPPKPKRKQTSDIAIPSSLDVVVHERDMTNLLDIPNVMESTSTST